MDSIITTNLKDITLSSQFLTLTTPKGEIEIDIKQLLKEPLNSDSAFFNATEIAKMYDKDLSNFTRTIGYEKYLELLNRDYHGIKMAPNITEESIAPTANTAKSFWRCIRFTRKYR